jgi:hypothetical protein
MCICHRDTFNDLKKTTDILGGFHERSVEVLVYYTHIKDVMLTYNVSINYPGTSSGNNTFQECSYLRKDSILSIPSPDTFGIFA